eukprot:6205677-Pleurochrysis_carterae.AAC.3
MCVITRNHFASLTTFARLRIPTIIITFRPIDWLQLVVGQAWDIQKLLNGQCHVLSWHFFLCLFERAQRLSLQSMLGRFRVKHAAKMNVSEIDAAFLSQQGIFRGSAPANTHTHSVSEGRGRGREEGCCRYPLESMAPQSCARM